MAQDYKLQHTGSAVDRAVGRANNPKSVPEEGSSELITSGGVYGALKESEKNLNGKLAQQTQNVENQLKKTEQDIKSIEGNVGEIALKVNDVGDKVNDIKKETTSSSVKDVKFEKDNGEKIGVIDDDGADFVHLKRNGHEVATEDELPTIDAEINEDAPSPSNVPSSSAVSGYVKKEVGKLPISEDTTKSSKKEAIFAEDDYDENAPDKSKENVKIGDYGIKAKAYLDLDGNPIKTGGVEFGDMNMNQLSYGANNTLGEIWFYPEAVFASRRRKSLFFGFVDADGYAGAAMCNVDAVHPSVVKNRLKLEYPDQHDSASVSLLEDGRVLCIYPYGHNTGNTIHVRRSIAPYSVDNFETLAVIESSDFVAYSQVHYVNGKWFVFFRSPIKQWQFSMSEDLVNWSEPKVFIIDSNEYQRYILFKPISGETTKLRFVTYSNPSYTDTNLRSGYFDVDTMDAYNSNGTFVCNINTRPIATDELPILVQQPTANDSSTLDRIRLFDVAVTDLSHLEFCYCKFTYELSQGNDSKYFVYRDGNEYEICEGGQALWIPKMQCGMQFINDNMVVVGRSGKTSKGKDYIELYSYADGAWSLTKEIFSDYKGDNGRFRNAFPLCDIDGKYVIWYSGYYYNYGGSDRQNRGYDMDVRIYDVENDKIII